MNARRQNLIKKPTLPISLPSVSAAIQFVYVSQMSACVCVCENTRTKSVIKCEDDDVILGSLEKVQKFIINNQRLLDC